MRIAALSLLLGCTPAAAVVTCSIATNPLPFGNYSSASLVPSDTQANLTLSCSSNQPLDLNLLVNYSVSLSAGNSGSTGSRYLLQGASRLNYNLYRDVARATLWGSGADASNGSLVILSLLPLNNSATLTVFGRIPAQQTSVAAGSYSDTITVTATY